MQIDVCGGEKKRNALFAQRRGRAMDGGLSGDKDHGGKKAS